MPFMPPHDTERNDKRGRLSQKRRQHSEGRGCEGVGGNNNFWGVVNDFMGRTIAKEGSKKILDEDVFG